MSNETLSFLRKMLNVIENSGVLCPDPNEDQVIEFLQPHELQDKFEGVSLSKDSVSDEELLGICEKVLRYSAKTNHPYFLNQLYHGVDIYGLAGSWLSETLNTNSYTFEVAPVFTCVEKSFLSYTMTRLFRWINGDGIFSPGGSISNMYGLACARFERFPEAKSKGMNGIGPCAILTSDESHYSILKAAHWLGIGTDNVVKVLTDDKGSMIPLELERAILKIQEENKIPLFVNATGGTTVMGGYDDLEAISEICSRYKIWLHLDACWGGSAILSPKHRHLLKGCEKVDSISWNPHKMIGAPLQASVFLVKRPHGFLHECNSASANYLFQQDKYYDVSFDTGDKSVQCGRKVDAFKVWFMFKARGQDYLARAVDNAFEQSRYFAEEVLKRSKSFKLITKEPQCTNILFEYIPPCLRDVPENMRDEEWKKKLSSVAPRIKKSLVAQGSLMIGYQPLPHKGLGNCFRMIMHCYPLPTKADTIYVLNAIEYAGKDIIF